MHGMCACRRPTAFSKSPDLDHRVAPARDEVPVHVPHLLHRPHVSVGEQAGVLHARAVVHLRANNDDIAVSDARQDGTAGVRTLIPFSPTAATIFRVSNCSAVTAWSYFRLSQIPPVRRSQICPASAAAQGTRRRTHPYRLVEAAAHDVQLVELQTRHGAGVPQQGPVRLPGTH